MNQKTREPYESPQVTTIDIGDLLDEASRLLNHACNQLEAAKVEAERLQTVIRHIEADVEAAIIDIDKAKLVKTKVDSIIELTSREP